MNKVSLEQLANKIHKTAVEKGFWEDGNSMYVVGTKIALIHSEVTELLEAIRKEQGALATADESADILIRLLDLWPVMKELNLVTEDLDDVVWRKTEKNASRPYKHGNLF